MGAGEIVCVISDPAAMEMARREGVTRAAAAMRLLGDRLRRHRRHRQRAHRTVDFDGNGRQQPARARRR